MVPVSIPNGRIWLVQAFWHKGQAAVMEELPLPANLMSSPMPYPLGHRASELTPARQVAAGYLQQGKLASNTRRSSPVSFTGEVKQQGGAPHPANQSCCPCPCFPNAGIWPGDVTVSTPDSESGNRGSNPRRVRAARQAVSSPPSSHAEGRQLDPGQVYAFSWVR